MQITKIGSESSVAFTLLDTKQSKYPIFLRRMESWDTDGEYIIWKKSLFNPNHAIPQPFVDIEFDSKEFNILEYYYQDIVK